MTAQQAVAETLRQVLYGRDFEPIEKTLASVTPEKAVRVPPGCPYSIATNVSHAEQWQRSWLHQLQGLPRFDVWKDSKDFPIIEPEEWPAVRDAFVSGMKEALALAESAPFQHHVRTNESAIKKLNQIAVHNAYHIGQIKLLKRILRSTKAG